MLKRIISAAIAAALIVAMLLTASAEDPLAPAFSVSIEGAQICAGKEFAVDVAVKNNPGLTSANLKVEFDPSVFVLKGFLPLADQVTFDVNLEESLFAIATPNTISGEQAIIRFTFQTVDTLMFPSEGVLTETIAVSTEDATDGEGKDLAIASGQVVVNLVPPLWGDANQDNAVTLADALLTLRCAAGYVTDPSLINVFAANVIHTDELSVADAILIMRYVAGVFDPDAPPIM